MSSVTYVLFLSFFKLMEGLLSTGSIVSSFLDFALFFMVPIVTKVFEIYIYMYIYLCSGYKIDYDKNINIDSF